MPLQGVKITFYIILPKPFFSVWAYLLSINVDGCFRDYPYTYFTQDNYYRPKDSDTCFPCDCFHLGANSRTCDPETGQCPCKGGVIGRQCNRCDNPFFEVTNTGCEGKYWFPPTCFEFKWQMFQSTLMKYKFGNIMFLIFTV